VAGAALEEASVFPSSKGDSVSLYKRGRTWYIDYYYPPGRGGKGIGEKVGPEKDEARILLAERLQDIRQGRNPALRRIAPKPFNEVVKEFLEKHASTRRHYATFKKRTDLFVKHFGGMTIQEMTPAVIQDFISVRLASGISKATANRDRSMLHGIFNFAIRRGAFGGENPVHNLKPFPEPPGRLRFLSADEAERLLNSAARHLRPIIVCALHTGARHSEVLSLRWQDVEMSRGVIHFNSDSTKSGKARQVPISPLLASTLRRKRMSRLRGGEARDYVFIWRGGASGQSELLSVRLGKMPGSARTWDFTPYATLLHPGS